MATRDLHDQKILRALEGIEKQLKVQNGIFGDMSAEKLLAVCYGGCFIAQR